KLSSVLSRCAASSRASLRASLSVRRLQTQTIMVIVINDNATYSQLQSAGSEIAPRDEGHRDRDQHEVRERLGDDRQRLGRQRRMEAQRDDQPVHREIGDDGPGK